MTQLSLSAIWAVTTWIAAWIAGLSVARSGLAIVVVAIVQSLLAAGIQARLERMSRETWRSCAPIAAILAWVALSALVIISAIVSRTVASLLTLTLLWWTATARTRPRRYVNGDLDTAWSQGASVVIGVAMVIALYAAYPALNAASVGYGAYDRGVWIDAPFHASYVAAIASALTDGVYADVHGHGLSTQIYHLGVYAIPALIKFISGGNALAITQVFTAWGGLWLAVSLYAVATCFASRPLVAIVAASLALALPDPGQLSAGHPLFGFHWLLHVGSATSTGLAIALTAFAIMVHACRERSWQLILLAWFAAALVVVFKAQLFVIIAVPTFVLPAFLLRGIAAGRRAVIVSLQLALVMIVTWCASFSSNLPLIRLDFSAGAEWLSAVAPNTPAWMQAFTSLVGSWPRAPQLLGNLVMLTVWMLAGWGLLRLIIGGILSKPSGASTATVLLWLTAGYLLSVVGLAADNRNATGGPLEIHVQGQVFGYACFALWAALAVSERVTSRCGIWCAVIAVTAAMACYAWVSPLTEAIQRSAPIKATSLQLAPDPDTIAKLRASLNRCDIIFVADGDRFMAWQAALERPNWVTDYALNPKHRTEVTRRLSEWSSRTDSLEAWLSARGITLFILPINTPTAFSEAPSRTADFSFATFRAWRIPTTQRCLPQ